MGLFDCETCPKPHSLDPANELAIDCWSMVIQGERRPIDILQTVYYMGGTRADLNKVFLISKLYQEMNPT